jgi:hypothetical protein
MGILDRLKKTRQDDDDEDSQDVDEESDDEDSGKVGLWGRFGALRGMGGNAAGMLGKVLKRGGDDEDEDDEDEISGRVVVRPAPAVATSSPGESVVDFLSAEPDAAGSSDEDEPPPVAALVLRAGTAARASAKSDIFSVRIAVDPSLKDLAMSQDAISAQELAGDLEELVYRLTRKFSQK